MYINWFKKEIVFKIVYYGPGLSGKTTNLEYIYETIDPKLRSDLVSLKTTHERTLYFDFMQVELGRIKGKKPRFNIYTIPGQIYYTINRKLVLKDVDAIVFVADSQKSRMEDNLESLMDLEKRLILQKKSLAEIPWVIQYNKRDLANVLSIDILERKLNFLRVPYYEAVATNGDGVLATLEHAIRLSVEQ